MYSIHKFKQQQKVKSNSEQKLKVLNNNSKVFDNNDLVKSFRRRILKHSKNISQEHKDSNLYLVIRKGSVPLVHSSKHSFRNDCKCNNISVKKYWLYSYMKSEERAQRRADEFQKTHLEAEKYSDKKSYLKASSSGTPIRSKTYLSFRSKFNDAISRLQKNINLNILYTTEPMDTAKIENPIFREKDKSKWKGKVMFNQGILHKFTKD